MPHGAQFLSLCFKRGVGADCPERRCQFLGLGLERNSNSNTTIRVKSWSNERGFYIS